MTSNRESRYNVRCRSSCRSLFQNLHEAAASATLTHEVIASGRLKADLYGLKDEKAHISGKSLPFVFAHRANHGISRVGSILNPDAARRNETSPVATGNSWAAYRAPWRGETQTRPVATGNSWAAYRHPRRHPSSYTPVATGNSWAAYRRYSFSRRIPSPVATGNSWAAYRRNRYSPSNFSPVATGNSWAAYR